MKDDRQIPLFNFDGDDYVKERDQERLSSQIIRVFELMKDGRWRTLDQIRKRLGVPQASASAQLRNLRKKRFGEHTIARRYLVNGIYQYKLVLPK